MTSIHTYMKELREADDELDVLKDVSGERGVTSDAEHGTLSLGVGVEREGHLQELTSNGDGSDDFDGRCILCYAHCRLEGAQPLSDVIENPLLRA